MYSISRVDLSTKDLQQVELQCVQDYKYLGLIFHASGFFSHARQELQKKSLKCYYKLC